MVVLPLPHKTLESLADQFRKIILSTIMKSSSSSPTCEAGFQL